MTKKTLESSYLFGTNGEYIEALYDSYLKDPHSVDQEWQKFFTSLEERTSNLNVLRKFPWVKPNPLQIDPFLEVEAPAKPAKKEEPTAAASKGVFSSIELRSLKARLLIDAYREYGHFLSMLDPLHLEVKSNAQSFHLNPENYGLTKTDLEEEVSLNGYITGINTIKLKDLIRHLSMMYCGYTGIEVSHMQNKASRDWVIQKFEAIKQESLLPKTKTTILKDLLQTEQFEQFLNTRFPGTKRFSVEGGEGAMTSVEAVIEEAANQGVEEIVIGMAHRGRLNVLTKILQKPYSAMFSEFQGTIGFPEDLDISGDVKYHMGASTDKVINGKKIHLSLNANPSHLEAVNPVVEGKVRAKQDQRKDTNRLSVMPILMHGDAAFIGQGVVAETLMLSELNGYETGGTIHVIINNQVGFTTNPSNARSGRYSTEMVKIIQAPILHVNGDQPDEIVKAAKLAVAYRQQFKKDIAIEVICYRLHGHNETDEPMFTQPIMYKKIAEQPTTSQIYAKQLEQEGILQAGEYEQFKQQIKQFFDREFEAGKSYKPNKVDALEGSWQGLKRSVDIESHSAKTGVNLVTLQTIGQALCRVPEGFKLNAKVARQLEQKKKIIANEENLDWATAEALAFGSLLLEGITVRLSGQDVGRGTFSHRHSVFVDQENEQRYLPLNHLKENQATYEVIDSNLSEYGVLGFEYGYSLAEPNALVLWEGQFGDFSNGAQIIIDQFISSSETKWLRMSGLVMLLPHGYEGQGPEHSSARLERYLQLCAEDNMQVVNCSTPASYFHALRRQICREFRKPLIVMSPKSLLRNKVTTMDDLKEGTYFQRVIPETDKAIQANNVKKLVFCSGKIYFELVEERKKNNIKDIAIVRLEQYYPFPKEEILEEIKRYKNAEIIWCQEEPENMGAWFFVEPRLRELLKQQHAKSTEVIYRGRKAAASPAVGYGKIHAKEQAEILQATIR